MPVRRSKSKRKTNKWEKFLNDDFAILFEEPPEDMPEEIYLKAKKEAEERCDAKIKELEKKRLAKLWEDYIDCIFLDDDFPRDHEIMPEGMTPEIRDKLLKERKRKGKKDIYNI